MNMTYEQFEHWCKKCNYTIEEGFRAMCFVGNIIGQNFGNHIDYANQISNNNNHSDAFKSIVEKSKEDATLLLTLYGKMDNMIFEMLEKHDKEQTT